MSFNYAAVFLLLSLVNILFKRSKIQETLLFQISDTSCTRLIHLLYHIVTILSSSSSPALYPRPHSSMDLWSLSESRLWSSASLVTSASFLSTPWALLSIHWRLSMCAFRIWIKCSVTESRMMSACLPFQFDKQDPCYPEF